MKKTLLLAGAALIFSSALQAQDVYKQTGGERNIEFLFAPLGGSPIGIAGIKVRKFTSATSAIRATVFLGYNSSTEKSLGGADMTTELQDSQSAFDISIRPGIERHFAGTDRLSPYVGAEALINFSNSTEKMEMVVGTDVEENKTTNGSFGIGLNAIAGMDFYFADNIYLGAELGFGVGFTSEFDTKSSSTIEGAEDVETPNGSSLNFGPNVVGAIRLGFLF